MDHDPVGLDQPSPTLVELLTTPLHAHHREAGARLVPFAGYEMPVQYPAGTLAEHRHTRSSAGLFDVSHMGQVALRAGSHAEVSAALERLVPADILGLQPGRQRYAVFLNEAGGILDDLMVARPADPEQDGTLLLVVNASNKAADIALLQTTLAGQAEVVPLPDRALFALQGPEAHAVMEALSPDAAMLPFMGVVRTTLAGIPAAVSRSGYTGEDGFEISVAEGDAPALWRRLLEDPRVRPIGLGARDLLRLEAGLPLHGHDIDPTVSPVEAGLAWSIGKRRRQTGGFPGAARILRELAEGPARRRVGLAIEGRAPVREGASILDAGGEPVGTVTSGGFGPSVERPIAMGLVRSGHAEPGTGLAVELRGRSVPATVVSLPFHPHRYRRAVP